MKHFSDYIHFATADNLTPEQAIEVSETLGEVLAFEGGIGSLDPARELAGVLWMTPEAVPVACLDAFRMAFATTRAKLATI